MKMCRYTIRIPKLKLFGYHGCYDEEKKEGQEFEINIEVVFRPKNNFLPKKLSKLEDSFDYTKIALRVQEIFESKRCDMLEELARNIGDMLFESLQNWTGFLYTELIKVNIKKFNPEGMNISYVEVECVVSYDK